RSEPLQQFRLQGYTGVHTNAAGRQERVAVLYLGARVFVIRGEILDNTQSAEIDRLLLASIRTFRAIQNNERSNNNLRVRYVQVTEGFDWRILAAASPLQEYAEETLRLLNGYYPIGNPRPGEWIKILM